MAAYSTIAKLERKAGQSRTMPKRKSGRRHALWNRRQVAEALGCDKSAVRRMEASGKLMPILLDGEYLFDPQQVQKLNARNGPEISGAAFTLFAQGKTAIDVVIALNADPEAVERLFQLYHRLARNWVIQGPASLATWEKYFDLGELTPGKILCALELVGCNPDLRAYLMADADKPRPARAQPLDR